MSSMQKMIERINARLAALESESHDRPGWLTRLMLSDSLPLEAQVRRLGAICVGITQLATNRVLVGDS